MEGWVLTEALLLLQELQLVIYAQMVAVVVEYVWIMQQAYANASQDSQLQIVHKDSALLLVHGEIFYLTSL